MDALNDRGKALSQSKILVLGIAYKKNVDDMRESPSVEVMDMIRKKGAKVDYSDPFVPIFGPLKEYKYQLQSRPISQDMLSEYDAVVLATDHNDFDYDLILEASQLVVDTRGRYRVSQQKLVKA